MSKFSVNRDRPPYPNMSPEGIVQVGGSSKRRENYTPEEQVWNPDDSELEPTILFEGRKRK